MNKKSRLTVIKKLFIILGGGICVILLSCENFLDGSNFQSQLEKDIAYAEAKECTVIIKSDAAYGSFLSEGEKKCKVGYTMDLQFTVNQSDYIFKNLEAVSTKDNSISRNDAVEFTITESDEKTGTYKITVKLLSETSDILIRPSCILLPKITEITPAFSNNGIEQNTPIEITFNKSLDSATFTDFSSIILIENETRDLWEFFNTPYFSSSGTKLVIPPNPEKLILSPDGSQNLLEIKVTYDFSKADDIDGLPLDLNGSHSYRINKTFLDQKKVTLTVSSESKYGTFLSAGEKECTVGYTIDLQFTLNKESYIFKGLEAVSTGSDTILSEEDVLFTILESDDETGIYKVNVRVLKEINDILIRPKCTLIENAEVTITKSEKGTKNISPADGTKVQSFINRSYSVSITPDEDYEFIRWELYDIKTDSSITNGTYVTLEDPAQPSTNYCVTQVPDTAIELALRPVVAERPQIISNTPQNSGILKDSSIQVLFDHDMDEGSIYYSDDELESLIAKVGEDNLLSSAISKGKYYGYKKDGLTYYKNISLTNKKTGENLNDKFEAPVFENASTLTIPASKKEGKIIDDYTQVLVTLEKDFFYSEKIDETTSKPVTLRGSKKWLYQVTNHGDEAALVFQQKKGNDVFTLKLNEEAQQSLAVETAHPVIKNDGNGISALKFLRIKNEKPTLYCDMVLQDPAGGTGPNSTFTVCYERIKEGDYITDGSGTDVTGSFTSEYTATTSEDAIFKGDFDLQLPSDGTYRIWFDFTDRSNNHFYYPANANEPDSNDGFYVTKDVSSVSEPSNIIVESGANDNEYKLSWTAPQELDYDHTVITVVTGETKTSNTVNKGITEATINDILSDQSYVISITHYDYIGNKISSSVPKFLTGLSVDGTPYFRIAESIFFTDDTADSYKLTATAYFSDGSTGDISSSAIITSPATNIASTVEAAFTSGEITKKGSLPGKYLVAQSDAKTERPVKLTNYTGTLSGGTYYKFGDFPQTISALTGENAYTDEPVYKGWYLGSDGYFYAKCTEDAYTFYSSETPFDIKYSNGTKVAESTENSQKYFKVEPIKWRVLNPSESGNRILFAENILAANIPYYNGTWSRDIYPVGTIYKNNYKYSNIRAYLNGTQNQYVIDGKSGTNGDVDWSDKGFLQTAFTITAQGLIVKAQVDNSEISTNPASNSRLWNNGTNTFACSHTYDKVFLLSQREATTSTYGFPTYNTSGLGNSRIRITTDWAKANHAYPSNDKGYGGEWYLRSPGYSQGSDVQGVNEEGHSSINLFTSRAVALGIVPALRVSASNLP